MPADGRWDLTRRLKGWYKRRINGIACWCCLRTKTIFNIYLMFQFNIYIIHIWYNNKHTIIWYSNILKIHIHTYWKVRVASNICAFLNVNDNILFIIQILCWTLSTVCGTGDFHGYCEAGSISIIRYK